MADQLRQRRLKERLLADQPAARQRRRNESAVPQRRLNESAVADKPAVPQRRLNELAMAIADQPVPQRRPVRSGEHSSTGLHSPRGRHMERRA